MSRSESDSFACTLYANDGTELRFGPDEADASNVITDVSWGTEVPGWGFAEGSVTLSRPFGLSSLDANLFSRVRVYDRAGQVVYEGRLTAINNSSTSLELTLEGPLAHLDDDQSVRMIYRDTDLSGWEGMSVGRQLAIDAGTYRSVGDAESTFDPAGNPALRLMHDGGSWAANCGPRIEGCYDAGPGLYVSKVAATLVMSTLLQFYYNTSTGMRCMLFSNRDAAGSGPSDYSVIASGAASQAVAWTLPTARRCVSVQMFYNNPGALAIGANVSLYCLWTNLAVYGDHGLPVRGSEPNAGFFASDIVAHALARWAPLVDVAPGGIARSSLVIPHLAFREQGTTVRQVIESVSAYGASSFQPPDWGYYEDGFFWRPQGTYGRTWRLRRDQGAVPVDEGPTTETRCNGFIVNYTDANGTAKSVGPPGSGSDYETSLLRDDDPANPVNVNGIPARWGSRDVGIALQEGAVLFGQLLLREANLRRYAGSVELKGQLQDSAGNLHPAYMVRAGDYVVVEDDDDTTPKKVVSTSYSGGTLTATLDNKATSIDSILSRLEMASKPAGF